MSLDNIDEAEADIVSELFFLALLDGLMLKGLVLIQMEESNGSTVSLMILVQSCLNVDVVV